MSQKFLITACLALFSLGALLLFWQNERELDPDQGKNWWILSFTLPEQAESLSFTVENHSDQTGFQYAVSVGREIILKDTFTAKQRESTVVTLPSITRQTERVKITVMAGDTKKEIYR